VIRKARDRENGGADCRLKIDEIKFPSD
jgi:hypothetical protein